MKSMHLDPTERNIDDAHKYSKNVPEPLTKHTHFAHSNLKQKETEQLINKK